MSNIILHKALAKRAFFIFGMIFYLVSCASKESKESILTHLIVRDIDYIDHFEKLSKDYLETPDIQEVKLSRRSRRYLEALYMRIVINNELILKKKIKPQFHIIKSNLPFYFSLPNGSFFLSDTLLKKYVKSENLLVSLLANEIYRVHKLIYEKKVFIPVGFFSTKKMLTIHRLPLKIKMESLKWTYFILKRSGFDPYSVLSWLQIQNKSTVEFSMQSGTSQAETREEFLFKNFLAEGVGKKQNVNENQEANSSKGFYALQRSLL